MNKKEIKLIIISILSTYLIYFLWNHWVITGIVLFIALWVAAGHYGAIIGNKAFCKNYGYDKSDIFLKEPVKYAFGMIFFIMSLFDGGLEFIIQDIKNLLGVESIQFQWPIKFTKKI